MLVKSGIVDKWVDWNRLYIAQDTGSAIKGVVRADLYMGHGKKGEFIAKNQNFPGEWYIEEKMQILAPLPSWLAQEAFYKDNVFQHANDPYMNMEEYNYVKDVVDQYKLKTFVPLCEMNKERKDKYDSNYYKNYYKLMFGDDVKEPCCKDWYKEIFCNKSDGLDKVNEVNNKSYKK